MTTDHTPDQLALVAAAYQDAAKKVLSMQGRFPMGTASANSSHDVAVARIAQIVEEAIPDDARVAYDAAMAQARVEGIKAAIAAAPVQCPICYGTGEEDDAGRGDISFNRWTCRTCKGTKTVPNPKLVELLDAPAPSVTVAALLETAMPESFIGKWHEVTEWCSENGEAIEAQTAWGNVMEALRALVEGNHDLQKVS